jgi:hypothetical protein
MPVLTVDLAWRKGKRESGNFRFAKFTALEAGHQQVSTLDLTSAIFQLTSWKINSHVIFAHFEALA